MVSRVANVILRRFAAPGSCAERWKFSAEKFISARRSVLVENERKTQKAAWLGLKDEHEENRVDLHPSLVGRMQESFQSMPFDRAVFENVQSIMLQPKSAWCVLFGSVWRKPLEILRGEGKAYVMGLRHACRSTECRGKRLLFLLDNMALVLGASKGSWWCAKPQPHLYQNLCLSLFCHVHHPICRWIAPEDNPADDPSRSKRYGPSMHSDVDQTGRLQPLTRSCMPSSQPKPDELPVKKRKLESNRQVAPALVSPTKVEEGWKQVRSRRAERGRVRARAHATAVSLACQRPLFGESSFLERNRVIAATVQRHTVGRDGGGDAGTPVLQGYGHGAGDCLMAAVKFVGWIQSFSASSDALWRTPSLMEIEKRSRCRRQKSVRRYEKHARLLKETSTLSTATRKYGQLEISRMPRLLSGAQPLPPPVLTKLVRNRT